MRISNSGSRCKLNGLSVDRYLKMPVEEKRRFYSREKPFVRREQIASWSQTAPPVRSASRAPLHAVEAAVNDRVALFEGALETLEIDGVVNAANSTLLGGGGGTPSISRTFCPVVHSLGVHNHISLSVPQQCTKPNTVLQSVHIFLFSGQRSARCCRWVPAKGVQDVEGLRRRRCESDRRLQTTCSMHVALFHFPLTLLSYVIPLISVCVHCMPVLQT